MPKKWFIFTVDFPHTDSGDQIYVRPERLVSVTTKPAKNLIVFDFDMLRIEMAVESNMGQIVIKIVRDFLEDPRDCDCLISRETPGITMVSAPMKP